MRIDAHQHYWQADRSTTAGRGRIAGTRSRLPAGGARAAAGGGRGRPAPSWSRSCTRSTETRLDARSRPSPTRRSPGSSAGWTCQAPPDDARARARRAPARSEARRDPAPRPRGTRRRLAGATGRDPRSGRPRDSDVPTTCSSGRNTCRHVPGVVRALPGLRMVIDHIAKPPIREGTSWNRGPAELRAAAANPNVWCKLSGMITEADHAGWTADDLAPYVEVDAARRSGPIA